jgi:hypothetical protein
MEDKKEKKLGVADSFVGATGQNNVIKVMKMPFSVFYKCCAARHVTKKRNEKLPKTWKRIYPWASFIDN